MAPDTWVFSEFSEGSRYRKDSERMAALLAGLKSPYGTPYRIHRLRMRPKPGSGGEDYHAYINSFQSNGALFFPIYGDAEDEHARAIYAAALPGHRIVGVAALGTSWGDSVHCRTRNLLRKNTLFLFPRIEGGKIRVRALPSPGAELDGTPVVHLRVDGGEEQLIPTLPAGPFEYEALLGARPGARLSLYVSAADTLGTRRTHPRFAPEQTIEALVE